MLPLTSTYCGSCWELPSGTSPHSALPWVHSGCTSCVSSRRLWWQFYPFLGEGGPRILRSILGQRFLRAPCFQQSLFSVLVQVWETISGFLRIQRLRLDSGYTRLRPSTFMLIFTCFHVKASSDYEVDSRPRKSRRAHAVCTRLRTTSRPVLLGDDFRWKPTVTFQCLCRLKSTGLLE